MLLMFGKTTINTKGLPRVSVMNTYGHSDGATLYVLLESRTRAAVEKWAKRLGVEVTEDAGATAVEREVSANAESGGYQVCVYTYIPAPAAPAPLDVAYVIHDLDGTGSGACAADCSGCEAIRAECDHEFPPPTGDPDAEDYAPGDCIRCGMTYRQFDAAFGERMAEALEGGAS